MVYDFCLLSSYYFGAVPGTCAFGWGKGVPGTYSITPLPVITVECSPWDFYICKVVPGTHSICFLSLELYNGAVPGTCALEWGGGGSPCRARQIECLDARDNQKTGLGNQILKASCPVGNQDFTILLGSH